MQNRLTMFVYIIEMICIAMHRELAFAAAAVCGLWIEGGELFGYKFGADDRCSISSLVHARSKHFQDEIYGTFSECFVLSFGFWCGQVDLERVLIGFCFNIADCSWSLGACRCCYGW